MDEITLRQQVDELFASALKRTANLPALTNFHNLLQQCHQRLNQPMRVAIVGLIKAGKSTMMNALLGETVVATGAVEATFNVNWLRYGEKPSLLVHFKDSRRPPEPKPVEELAALTLRAEENRDYLLSIKYIEVDYPNPILQTFNLIDTPGLKSFYQDDSVNTLKFLQLHGDELTAVTQQEASNADAVLYLFSHSFGAEDKLIVEQFQGPAVGQATPINAIGVLTKVDVYDVPEPMIDGHRVARRLSAHGQVTNLFYTIYPVCGLLAWGAQTLTPDEFAILLELTQISRSRFESLLQNVERFEQREYPDIPVPPEKRRILLQRLGQYGVGLADKLIRQGINNQADLSNELLKRSGVPELRDLILSHFGHRAFLIKLSTGLRQIDTVAFQERQRLGGTLRQIVDEIAGKFEAINSQEHAFKELEVLRSYYEGKLEFDTEEVKQLLQVTGEYGTSCGERLGLDDRATIAEMLTTAAERTSYWHQRADDFFGGDRQTLTAAKVLARSYDRILYRVQKAKEYLEI
ncbi:dynamin family protein [Scytonema sp. UIC 10036]|uniref:dynamin family protein n=1 Tax=Scytonema sp. UIC 10036 TaxID=2304196 RepID=UPI0012DA475A|nr:dynamin family protein [Scytonema sp. UIC 10036]